MQKELLNTDRLLNCNTVSAKVTKELGKRWATLDSEMRKVYEEASLKDRKRYEMEKKIYKPSKEFLKKKAEFEGAPKLSSIKSPLPKVTETVTDHFEDYFNFLHINWKKVEFYLPSILNTPRCSKPILDIQSIRLRQRYRTLNCISALNFF